METELPPGSGVPSSETLYRGVIPTFNNMGDLSYSVSCMLLKKKKTCNCRLLGHLCPQDCELGHQLSVGDIFYTAVAAKAGSTVLLSESNQLLK